MVKKPSFMCLSPPPFVIPRRALRADPESRSQVPPLDSGFESIDPRLARARWTRPGMTAFVAANITSSKVGRHGNNRSINKLDVCRLPPSNPEKNADRPAGEGQL